MTTGPSTHADSGVSGDQVPAAQSNMTRNGRVPDPSNRRVAGKTMSAPLWTPAAMTRMERKRQSRQAHEVELTARRALMAERRAAIEASRAESREAAFLPEGGESGAAALRS